MSFILCDQLLVNVMGSDVADFCSVVLTCTCQNSFKCIISLPNETTQWLTHSPLSMAGEIKRQGQTWAWQNVDQLIHMQISASQERPHAMHILAPFIDLSRVRAPTQKGRKQPTTSAMAAKMAQPMKKFVTFCYVIFVGL